MRDLCVLCGKRVSLDEGRTFHLANAHGIEPGKGEVKRFFADSRYYFWNPVEKTIQPKGR